jgi:hypothetical protein
MIHMFVNGLIFFFFFFCQVFLMRSTFEKICFVGPLNKNGPVNFLKSVLYFQINKY